MVLELTTDHSLKHLTGNNGFGDEMKERHIVGKRQLDVSPQVRQIIELEHRAAVGKVKCAESRSRECRK